MKLHLIRHAQAKHDSFSGEDIDRELSTKGIEQAKELGEYLKNKGIGTNVWCSEAVRTKETFRIVSRYVRFEDITYFEEFYLASLETLLKYIWKREGDKDLVLIGHNFGISELASYLSGDQIDMGTSEYVCLEFNNLYWKETSADLGTIIDNYCP